MYAEEKPKREIGGERTNLGRVDLEALEHGDEKGGRLS
jgi:hypothetical protein